MNLCKLLLLLFDRVIDKILNVETCHAPFNNTNHSHQIDLNTNLKGICNGTESCYYFNILAGLLESLKYGLALHQTVFVNVGCGAGRPILVAMLFRFCTYIGVDLSPIAISMYDANLASTILPHSCTQRCKLHNRDVYSIIYELVSLEKPIMIFMFNPYLTCYLMQSLFM